VRGGKGLRISKEKNGSRRNAGERAEMLYLGNSKSQRQWELSHGSNHNFSEAERRDEGVKREQPAKKCKMPIYKQAY